MSESKDLSKINHAMDFFAATPPITTHMLAVDAAKVSGTDDKFTAGAGLMSFAFNDEQLATDPDIVTKVTEAKYYLKGFMSLVTAKLFGDNTGNINEAFRIPPSDVKEIAVHLPLLAGFVAEEYQNHEEQSVVEFSTSLITTILDVSLDNYPGAVKKVTSWLQDLGGKITASHSGKYPTYDVTVFSGIINVTKVGGIIDIEPALQIAGASLAVSDVKNSIAGCVEKRSFTLDFDAPYFRAPFNYDALSNKKIKEKLDTLVTDGSVKQIDGSRNYFGVTG